MPSLSILIVDDEKLNLDVLSHFLSDEYEIYAVRSGKAALKTAAANRPDLILLDIVMPEMNGYEVLARLKESEDTKHIPVVLVTSLDNAANEEKGLRLGAVDYITKPFNDIVVKARVRALMKIARQLRTLESHGMIDMLTGLPNRRYFDLQCRIEWLRAARENASVHLFTVESVGPLPDEAGERKIAHLLSDVLESYPSGFVARIDPARFGLLLLDVDHSRGAAVAETIRDRFQNTPVMSASGEHLTVCIEKCSVMPNAENSVNDLLTQTSRSHLSDLGA